jgi:hypothetical protein
MRRRFFFGGAVALVAVGLGVGIWSATGSNRQGAVHAQPPVQTAARTRALAPVSACLLTDAGGVSHSPASAVWAGVQAAVAKSQSRATFLPVPSAKLADSMLNSMLEQHCSVVIGVDTAEITAVEHAAAASHPGVRFAVATAGPVPSGVSGFAATKAATDTAVAGLLAKAAG